MKKISPRCWKHYGYTVYKLQMRWQFTLGSDGDSSGTGYELEVQLPVAREWPYGVYAPGGHAVGLCRTLAEAKALIALHSGTGMRNEAHVLMPALSDLDP